MVVTLHGIEIDGEFKEAVIEASAMNRLPYTVRIHKTQSRKAMHWCEQNLGPRWEAIGNKNGIWCCFWAGRDDYEHYNFYFLNERDMIWVALKWL